MNGWAAVVVITALMVLTLIGLNVHLYRRLKQATAVARAKAGRGSE